MPAFLLKYHRRSGKVEVSKFASLLEATKQSLVLDRINDDPELEIVAIASCSEQNLRYSHSRYFSAA